MDSAILAKEALKLPPLERAQIIDALWRSLDPAEQESIDRDWLLESQDRLAAFRAGQLIAIDGEEALRAIKNEFTEFPALDEYGVTLEQATAAEDSALAEIKADGEARRLKDSSGKLV